MLKLRSLLLFSFVGTFGLTTSVLAQSTASPAKLQVILLGTAGGPVINPSRLGISTLVVAGSERLVFDLGRSSTTALPRLGINPSEITKVFLTHLHSDHIFDLPVWYPAPWESTGRTESLRLWGPAGTREMVSHLRQAFEFDIHVRRDVDERFPASGIQLDATDIKEGVVYESNGVKVTAFLVDHEPVQPAFGYRVDYSGHSVVLSGDTRPSDNLVAHAQGADLLIHEIGRWKKDPLLAGPADEKMPNSGQTRAQVRNIIAHHTDGEELGQIFSRTKPKLALVSHYNVASSAAMPLIRRNYGGDVEFGEDLMTIDIGDTVVVRRFVAR